MRRPAMRDSHAASPPLCSAGVHPSWDNITDAAEFMARVHATTHCSGLVKVTGNYSDLFWGHSAWFIYQVRARWRRQG